MPQLGDERPAGLLCRRDGSGNVTERIEYKEIFREDYERLEVVEVSMTESQVRQLLGEPHRVYEVDTAPEDYYVEGRAYKRRPITNKVFIYHGGEPILYVWFDKKNRVEEVFVGGS